MIEKPKAERDKLKFVLLKIKGRMESDSSSDSSLSDSGLSADSSQSSSVEGKTTVVAAPKETPIEREIRRSVERERSLRRSRGLPNVTPPEYVEIPMRNAVLYQSVTTYADRSQGKDRQLAGEMSYEVNGEIKRQKDIVDSGKYSGFYDKSVSSQLKERKQLFEAFQIPKEYKNRASAAYSVSTFDDLRGMSLNGSEPSASYGTKSHWQSQNSPKKDLTYLIYESGSLDTVDSHESQQRVLAQKAYHTKTKTQSITVVESGRPKKSSKKVKRRKVRASEHRKEAEVSARENPFFKLRSSATLVKVEQDIREGQERERELRKQRISLYSSKEGGHRSRFEGGVRATEEEVRPKLSLSSSSSSSSSSSDSESSSDRVASVPSQRKITGPPAARHSVGKFDVWPPTQLDIEKANHLEHAKYIRKSTTMVERWTNGQVNSHSEDSD